MERGSARTESGSGSGSGPLPDPVPVLPPMPVHARLDWLDALKGLGIVAVVAGHVWTQGPLRDAIYAFHMPLFFMASGAVARAVPMRLLGWRLVRGLGLPFLSFSLLLLAADVLIEGLRGVRPIFPSFVSGLWTIAFSTDTLRGPFGIFWFVPCLLIARLLWNGLLQATGDPRSRGMLLAMAGVLALALLADLSGTASPLGLRPMPAALLLIWFGALWREWQAPLPVAFVLSGLALVALCWFPPLNMRAGDLGWPALGLLGAIAIVDRLGALMRHLPPGWIGALGWLGQRSLVIMFLHLAFIHYLAPYASELVRFGTAIGGALLVDWLARQSAPSRLLLLGQMHRPQKG